jgi:hypothetical protein
MLDSPPPPKKKLAGEGRLCPLNDLTMVVDFAENVHYDSDLFLSLSDDGERISGNLNYAADPLRKETVNLWLARF